MEKGTREKEERMIEYFRALIEFIFEDDEKESTITEGH